jgi:hypothetical protein
LTLKLADGVPLILVDGHCGPWAANAAVVMAIEDPARVALRWRWPLRTVRDRRRGRMVIAPPTA